MKRREREARIVEQMIRLYCRHHEHHATLCPQCRELLDYARQRLANCPFGDDKPTCRHCPRHCYKPAMRQHIQQIMRWTGPRMIWFAPLTALRHWLRR